MKQLVQCVLYSFLGLTIVPTFLFANHDTLYTCQVGASLQLSYTPGYAVYNWTPTRHIDDPNIHNPTVSPVTNTTYVLEALTSTGDNLILNAEFSEGNSSFTSEYPFVPNAITTQGVYSISTNPSQLNAEFFAACRDHTDSTGNMMVVDGFPAADVKVWCQTIAVRADTRYAFSAWVATIFGINPALLQFSINGVNLGEAFRASSNECEWRQFYETWDSGSATEAEICIVNQNLNRQGNDFVLDDFAFFEIGEVLRDTFSVFLASPAYTVIDTSICRGELLEVGGRLLPADTSLVVPLKTTFGCDSLVEVNVAVLDTIFEFLRVDTLCPGDVFSFLENTIVQDTVICETVAISPSCDSSYCLVAVYLTETSIGPLVQPPSCPGAADAEIMLFPEAGVPPYTFRWETDGSDLPGLFELSAGSYLVSVMDSKGCLATATIPVEDPPLLRSLVDATSDWCNGIATGQLSMRADGGTPPYDFSFDGGQSFFQSGLIESLSIGTYQVVVRDANGCEVEEAIEIPMPTVNRLVIPPDALLNLGDSLLVALRDEAGALLNYQWLPEDGVACPICPVTLLRPLESTTYKITATDAEGCSIEGVWRVEVTREQALFYPNVFSPNGDGINDLFTVLPGPGVRRILAVAIFDRWGNSIFERNDCGPNGTDCPWDGRVSERDAGEGVYVLLARVEYIDGYTEVVSGDLLLLR